MPYCLAMRTTRGSAWPGAAPASSASAVSAVSAAKARKCLRNPIVILPEGLAIVVVALSSTTSRPGGKQRSGIGSSFMSDLVHRIETALDQRFGERFHADATPAGLAELAGMAAHRVRRRYQARDVAPDLVRLLCACALSAPTKSDLQQSDILI